MDQLLLCLWLNRTISPKSILGSLSSRSSYNGQNKTFSILNPASVRKLIIDHVVWAVETLAETAGGCSHQQPKGSALGQPPSLTTRPVLKDLSWNSASTCMFFQVVEVLMHIFRHRVNLRYTICWLTELVIIQWFISAFFLVSLKESSLRVALSQIGSLCSPHFWLN